MRLMDQPQPRPSRRARQRGEGRPPFQDRLIPTEHQVVRDPERRVPEPLGGQRQPHRRRGVERGVARRAEKPQAGRGEDRHTETERDRRHRGPCGSIV